MGMQEKDPFAQLSLPPGFRFYPTDEELLVQYLCRKVAGHPFSLQIIGEVDLYKFDPWVLPDKAMFGEKEWYFFSPRVRKYPNGSRPNRVAGLGYWKATGTDKVITTQGRRVGIKKSLVFYIGKAPKGTKTNWIMHEYRLTEPTRKIGSSKLDDWVLCRIYKKSSGTGKLALTSSRTKEHRACGGSSSSSSSHLDDIFDPLPPEIHNVSRSIFTSPPININSFKIEQQDNKFTGLQNLRSGSFHWSLLAGIASELGPTPEFTQPHGHVSNAGNDIFAPSLPSAPFSAPLVTDQEVQSGVRTDPRVPGSDPDCYKNETSSLFISQSYSSLVDPFETRYPNQPSTYGFGYRFKF